MERKQGSQRRRGDYLAKTSLTKTYTRLSKENGGTENRKRVYISKTLLSRENVAHKVENVVGARVCVCGFLYVRVCMGACVCVLAREWVRG